MSCAHIHTHRIHTQWSAVVLGSSQTASYIIVSVATRRLVLLPIRNNTYTHTLPSHRISRVQYECRRTCVYTVHLLHTHTHIRIFVYKLSMYIYIYHVDGMPLPPWWPTSLRVRDRLRCGDGGDVYIYNNSIHVYKTYSIPQDEQTEWERDRKRRKTHPIYKPSIPNVQHIVIQFAQVIQPISPWTNFFSSKFCCFNVISS